jgi:3-oxoacyl-[acyl-carrier protein] reductase
MKTIYVELAEVPIPTPHFKTSTTFPLCTSSISTHHLSIPAPTMSKPSERYAQKALERLDILKSHLSDVNAPAGRLTKLSRSLQGKKAIVTGAASGMGKETAKVLADEGVQVAVLDLDEGKVKVVVDEINTVHPGRAKGWLCDVADRSRIKQVCREVIETFGGLDVRGHFPGP